MEQIQQGDVCLERVNKVPVGAKKLKRAHQKGTILAEGEATGHHHAIADECELYELNGVLYLENEHPVKLSHEEHHTQTIEPGIWQIGIVKEYDYFEEVTRNVAD